MAEKFVLTKLKIEQLKKELKKLEAKRDKEHSESLEQARMSDVSEDTDNINAVMIELEKIDKRIEEIKEVLDNSREMKKEECLVDKIDIGSVVKLKSKDKILTYSIVSEVEANPSENKISDKSPLGKALLNAKVGDTVKIRVGLKRIPYEVLEISC
ncbi:MAG: GreA/GreB family elongation factor [Candidatus Dojkabacteria bacterium]